MTEIKINEIEVYGENEEGLAVKWAVYGSDIPDKLFKQIEKFIKESNVVRVY